jgi:hypothetical protein
LGVTKKDEQNLDRWHRNEGRTDHDQAKSKAGAKEGNLRTLKHGIFADRCLTPEEKVMFDSIIEKLHEDFQFNKSSDFLQVELVGIYSVKLVRAQIEGNTQAAEWQLHCASMPPASAWHGLGRNPEATCRFLNVSTGKCESPQWSFDAL